MQNLCVPSARFADSQQQSTPFFIGSYSMLIAFFSSLFFFFYYISVAFCIFKLQGNLFFFSSSVFATVVCQRKGVCRFPLIAFRCPPRRYVKKAAIWGALVKTFEELLLSLVSGNAFFRLFWYSSRSCPKRIMPVARYMLPLLFFFTSAARREIVFHCYSASLCSCNVLLPFPNMCR